MCCKSSAQTGNKGQCCCGSSTGIGPLFWSEKKRRQMVTDSIDCLQSQVKDLKEYLRELDGKP